MALILPPLKALRPYVASVWASARGEATATGREHVLPCGQMHLAVRLDHAPLRLFADADDRAGDVIGDAVVAGARAGYYIKDMSVPARSVGVQLRPGAAAALFGVSAAALQGHHVPLDALWGADARRLRERLHETPDPRAQLDVLQTLLLARLRVRALHPAVAQALVRMEMGTNHDDLGIRGLVDGAASSHRHFIARFRDATGLSPKRYTRVLRFRRLLQAFAADPTRPWIDLALAAGYSDQSHCIREFREFAGVAPQAYRRATGAAPLHLPMPGRR
ncbi:helix-turn-helix domain-containing protein [Lysobacter cavernae]|uniref:Helix-turn-helix domain-containing protein n=1 Tax=Lysobacter cavernae TaxID=1685901 RepID=A0ABV7RPS1_9GAMM